MCVAHAPAHMMATRLIGKRARAAIRPAMAATTATETKLCVTVRWKRPNGRSRSGAAASTAQASVRPFPARSYHEADGGAVLHARVPGTRSAPHATAIPASAWPIGLAMRDPIIADSANRPNERRKWRHLQLADRQDVLSMNTRYCA